MPVAAEAVQSVAGGIAAVAQAAAEAATTAVLEKKQHIMQQASLAPDAPWQLQHARYTLYHARRGTSFTWSSSTSWWQSCSYQCPSAFGWAGAS